MNAQNNSKSEYIILKSFDADDLAHIVGMCIKDGYRPHGSLVIIQPIWHNGHIIKQAEYLQPMTCTGDAEMIAQKHFEQ